MKTKKISTTKRKKKTTTICNINGPARGHFRFKRCMMKKLELYFFPACPYCQIVLSALKETKLEDKVTMLDIHKDPASKKKLVEDTGRGTVPCLYIDGKPMHESRDIAIWLKNYAKELS